MRGYFLSALGLPLGTISTPAPGLLHDGRCWVLVVQASSKQTNIIMPTTMADETEQQLREKIAPQMGSIADLPTLRSIARETGLVSCIIRDNSKGAANRIFIG